MPFLSDLAIKHRHLLTRAGNIRLRYVAIIILSVGALIWALPPMSSDDDDGIVIVEEQTTVPVDGGELIVSKTKTYSNDPEESGRGLDPYYSFLGMKPENLLPEQWTKTIAVVGGDTLGGLMEKTTITGDEYWAAMKAIKKYVDPKDIMPGQSIDVAFRNVEGVGVWQTITYRIDGLNSVVIQRDAHQSIIADKMTKKFDVLTHADRAVVKNSLYADLEKAGVPDGIINTLIKAYSWSIDFQRDIWGGETIELLYETKETADGEYMRSGRLLYAKLTIRGKEIPMYFFEKDKGYPSYFEPSGQSVKKALLKTPVDGARISSGFGRRKHPVLGYTKVHKGLDFAAPRGTPVYAAGDGVVERANRFSSFGNYVKIRHNDTYKTAYAHLQKFAKGIHAGSRVKQGQVIAYVGTTGRSTGPHLHYEVHVNGKQVNPQSIKLPLSEKLKGKDLTRFKANVSQLKAEFNKEIAQSDTRDAFKADVADKE